jgi:hypothetical protein
MEGVEWTKVKYISFNINNEKKYCKISSVGWARWEGEGEGRRFRLQCMVEGLYTPI